MLCKKATHGTECFMLGVTLADTNKLAGYKNTQYDNMYSALLYPSSCNINTSFNALTHGVPHYDYHYIIIIPG